MADNENKTYRLDLHKIPIREKVLLEIAITQDNSGDNSRPHKNPLLKPGLKIILRMGIEV